jgi:hypothetical protein
MKLPALQAPTRRTSLGTHFGVRAPVGVGWRDHHISIPLKKPSTHRIFKPHAIGYSVRKSISLTKGNFVLYTLSSLEAFHSFYYTFAPLECFPFCN